MLQNSLQLNTQSVTTASKWFSSAVPLGHSTLMNAKMRELMAATGQVEITDKSGMIEANTKLMVRRVPYKEWETIEMDYHLDRLVGYETGNDCRNITELQHDIRLQSLKTFGQANAAQELTAGVEEEQRPSLQPVVDAE